MNDRISNITGMALGVLLGVIIGIAQTTLDFR
jgi:hypothetical protein